MESYIVKILGLVMPDFVWVCIGCVLVNISACKVSGGIEGTKTCWMEEHCCWVNKGITYCKKKG